MVVWLNFAWSFGNVLLGDLEQIHNFDERIDQKIFHAEIVVDSVKVSAEMKAYQPIPVIVEFKNEDGSDNLKETIEANYRKVKQEILSLVDFEIKRIKKDPILSNLIKG